MATKEQSDAMSTFFIAETMKYFYLMFAGGADVGTDLQVYWREGK